MGHTRLGTIPKTAKWTAVVSLIAGPPAEPDDEPRPLQDQVHEVAGAVLDATEAGFERAIRDTGLRYSFYLLTQLALAAREDRWKERLGAFGVRLTDESTPFDLTLEVHRAIDAYTSRHGGPSDVGEMAQKATGEALTAAIAKHERSLFDSEGQHLQSAIHGLSSKIGFSELGQRFFGRFLARFLNFYVSRITASEVGSQRLPSVAELSRFNEALSRYSHESARIVRDFCGEWYSKTEFRQGIDLANASNFVSVAIRKLQAEVKRQRVGS